MRAAEHAPRDPSRVLERRHGLAEIVEHGAVVLVPDDAPPPLERAHGRPVMMSRPCRKFRRLDAPVLSPISRVDENNGYGDDAALELALQASLEDAARATPRRKAAPPPGPQLHPFG